MFGANSNPLVPLVLAYQPPTPISTIRTMSENSLEAQPRCAKANTHPAQVLLDGKQKCHTTTKKAANDKAKATQELEEATNAWKNQEAAIAQISNLKDTIQQED